jgi:hypothetical protein
MATVSTNSLIHAALKASQPIVREYVRALQTENAKLQRSIAQLETRALSKDHRILELEKEFKRLGHKTLASELGDRLDAAKKRLSGTRG